MLVSRAPNPAQSMAYCTPAHSPEPHFNSAQHHQSLLQQCWRSAGLQLHHSHALLSKEQLLPDPGNAYSKGGPE